MKLEHDSCRFREQRERNKSTEGILPLETHLSHPDGNSSTTCVLQVHTNLARHRFTRVAFWRMHSSAARDLARSAYSRFNASLDRLTKIKSPSLVNPANFSPKRRNIWSRRRTPSRGGNWRGTPFLGLLNLGEGRFRSTGSFFQFSVDTVSPRGFAKRNADRILSSAFLELSSRAKSLGILIEIDEKISGKFTRNIYQNIPFPGIPSELQSVKFRSDISFPSASNWKIFPKKIVARKQRFTKDTLPAYIISANWRILANRGNTFRTLNPGRMNGTSYVTPYTYCLPVANTPSKVCPLYYWISRGCTRAYTRVSHACTRERTVEAFVPRVRTYSLELLLSALRVSARLRLDTRRPHVDPSVSRHALASLASVRFK